VPTHLNVEDTLLGKLTPSQLVRLAGCLSLAYAAWDQLTFLPDPVRAGLAGALVLVGVLGAWWRPEDCSLDTWALAILTFGLAPRRLVWQRPEPRPADWRIPPMPEWAELDLELGWRMPGPDPAPPPTSPRAGSRR
jgi:hypothetical protein